jgi:hypothetical protein
VDKAKNQSGQNQSRRTASSAWVYRKELDATWFSRNLANGKSRLQDKAWSPFPAKQTSLNSKNAGNRQVLWKNACISTGSSVQNAAFLDADGFCPRSVQLRYNAFPADPLTRKPLTL